MTPTVSVILPNYNHARYLTQRIDSILNQTYQDFELIILDDCSTDNSREVLLKYKDHPKVSHLIFNEQNSGSTFKQWDKGIKLAKGKYIWIAESDDWAEPDFLQIMIERINNRDNVGLAYCRSNYVDTLGNLLWENQIQLDGSASFNGRAFIKQHLVVDCTIDNVSSVLFRNSLYVSSYIKQVSSLKLCGDWMFYVLICNNSDVIYVQKALNNFRRHKYTTSLKLEKKGMGLIEGVDVFDFIVKEKLITLRERIRSSFEIGKKWFRNEKIYFYSRSTNKKIKKRLFKSNLYLSILYFELKKIRNKIFLKNIGDTL